MAPEPTLTLTLESDCPDFPEIILTATYDKHQHHTTQNPPTSSNSELPPPSLQPPPDDSEHDDATARIGRSRSSTHHISHMHISGKQATIQLRKVDFHTKRFSVTIVDSSSNGTWVDGERLTRNEPFSLEGGNVITFLVPNIDRRDEEYSDEVPAYTVGRPIWSCDVTAYTSRRAHPPQKPAAEAGASVSTRQSRAASQLKRRAAVTASTKKELSSVSKRGRTLLQPRADLGLLDLPTEAITAIVSLLDLPSLLAASATCSRMYVECGHVPALDIRSLRVPLNLERATSLFARYDALRTLHLGAGCLEFAWGCVPGLGVVGALLPSFRQLDGTVRVGLEELNLEGNTLFAEGADVLCAALREGAILGRHPLRVLNLSNTQLGTRQCERSRSISSDELVPLIAIHAAALRELRLAGNAMGPRVAEVICQLNLIGARGRLRVLDLSGNQLSDVGVKAIAKKICVKTSSSLVELRLDSNFVTDKSCLVLSRMFTYNRTLRVLSLAWNAISAGGGYVLLGALNSDEMKGTALRTLDLSYNPFVVKATHGHGPDNLRCARMLRQTSGHGRAFDNRVQVLTWGM